MGTHLLMRHNFAQARGPSSAEITSGNISSVASRKPYPNFGVFINSLWGGNSNYNSFNTKFERRTGSMIFTTVYTWAKSIDNKSAAAGIGQAETAGWQGFLDNHDIRRDRGRSAFDVDHRLVSSFVYQLPFGRGGRYLANASAVVDGILGGWQVNGIATFQNGFPYSVFARDIGGVLDSFGTNRADVVGDHSGHNPTIAEWFRTSAFAQPILGAFGDSGRSILRGPGINNWDLALFKNFNIREVARLQFRFESFNAFNHTQWNTPVRNVVSPQYGQITSARDARINQVGVTILWYPRGATLDSKGPASRLSVTAADASRTGRGRADLVRHHAHRPVFHLNILGPCEDSFFAYSCRGSVL